MAFGPLLDCLSLVLPCTLGAAPLLFWLHLFLATAIFCLCLAQGSIGCQPRATNDMGLLATAFATALFLALSEKKKSRQHRIGQAADAAAAAAADLPVSEDVEYLGKMPVTRDSGLCLRVCNCNAPP